MAYVYRHIRLDKNIPFYIGIGGDCEGKYKRAHEVRNRSIYWKRVANKGGVLVEILMDGLTWEQACDKEIEFIKLYGRANLGTGILVNCTDGGDGAMGLIVSKETREKIRISRLGNKVNIGKKYSEERVEKVRTKLLGQKRSAEVREKMSKSHTGVKLSKTHIENARLSHIGKKRTQETKDKISKAHVGKVFSKETREKMRIVNTGKKLSEDHKDKIRNSLIGKNKGKKWSEEMMAKQKLGWQEKRENGYEFKKIPKSKETRDRIRKALTGRKMPEEQRLKMIGRKLSEEHKEKIRESHSKRLYKSKFTIFQFQRRVFNLKQAV